MKRCIYLGHLNLMALTTSFIAERVFVIENILLKVTELTIICAHTVNFTIRQSH